MFITKMFKFDAAHNLIKYHGKCERLHGHTYRLDVTVQGTPDEEGMIVDFVILKQIVKREVLSQLDHSYINDIISQPTAENISVWVWDKLVGLLSAQSYHLYEVKVYETQTSYVTYRGERN